MTTLFEDRIALVKMLKELLAKHSYEELKYDLDLAKFDLENINREKQRETDHWTYR